MRFYIDGVSQGTLLPTGWDGSIQYWDNPNTDFYIGKYMENEFEGYIEDFAYWDSDLGMGDLNDTKIQLLAKSFKKRMPLQIEPSNLMLYLPFDDMNIGTVYGTAKDLSGNGRDATKEGSPEGAEGILSYPSKVVSV